MRENDLSSFEIYRRKNIVSGGSRSVIWLAYPAEDGNGEIVDLNHSFVTYKKLNGSGDTIPIVTFTNDPMRATMDETVKWLAVALLVEIMLGIGCTVDLKKMKKHIRRPLSIGIASLTQFIFMPLLIFGAIKVLGIPHVPAAAVLVTFSIPGGISSNVLACLARGDASLSNVMTFCSSILAVAFIPLNLFVYGSHWLSLDEDRMGLIAYPTILISLLLLLVPAGFGTFIGWAIPNVTNKVITICKALLVATVLAIVILSTLLYKDLLVRYVSKEMWMLCAIMPMIGFAFGYVLSTFARVGDETRRTVAVETMCQNGLLGFAILKVAFPSHLMGSFFAFPLFYSLFQFAEGLLVVAFLRYKLSFEETSKLSHNFSTLGVAPVRRISKVSLYVIDQMRRRFSSNEKDRKSSSSPAASPIDEKTKKRPLKKTYSHNIIKTAIAEEEEPQGIVSLRISDPETDQHDSCCNDDAKSDSDVTTTESNVIKDANDVAKLDDVIKEVKNDDEEMENENNIINNDATEKVHKPTRDVVIKIEDASTSKVQKESTTSSYMTSSISDVSSVRHSSSYFTFETDSENVLLYTTGSSFEDIDFSIQESDGDEEIFTN